MASRMPGWRTTRSIDDALISHETRRSAFVWPHSLGGLPAGGNDLVHNGENRERHDRKHDEGEVVLDEGQVAEEEARAREETHPESRPRDVVLGELGVLHGADSSDERGKGADNGDEACEHNGLPAVLLVEFLGLVDVLALEEARLDGPSANPGPEGVVQGVAQDPCNEQEPKDERKLEGPQGAERPAGEEKGVTGQEGRDDQPRLAEHDGEEDGVRPGPMVRDERAEVLVE